MANSIQPICVLLIVLCVADGQSTTPDSHCSYTFKVPAADCGQTTADDALLKNAVVALQAQVKLQNEDIRRVKDENVKLRQEMATIKADALGGTNRSAANLKQCSMRGMNDGKENGLLLSCGIMKKRDDTVLRVVWNGDLRLIDTGTYTGSCRRWFFTINGQECSEPRTIDTQLHIRAESTNIHRPAYVEGYCRGIPAGQLYIAWNVGDCPNQKGYNVGDSYTGWVATVRIIVEEIGVEHADNAID